MCAIGPPKEVSPRRVATSRTSQSLLMARPPVPLFSSAGEPSGLPRPLCQHAAASAEREGICGLTTGGHCFRRLESCGLMVADPQPQSERSSVDRATGVVTAVSSSSIAYHRKAQPGTYSAAHRIGRPGGCAPGGHGQAPVAGAARDPKRPNLRQVHLIHSELHDELREAGFQRRGWADGGEHHHARYRPARPAPWRRGSCSAIRCGCRSHRTAQPLRPARQSSNRG